MWDVEDIGPAEKDSFLEELIYELERLPMRLDCTPCPRCDRVVQHNLMNNDGSHVILGTESPGRPHVCEGFKRIEYNLPLWVRALKRIMK